MSYIGTNIRLPNSITWTDQSTWSTIISNLRGYFTSGVIIRASHFAYLRDATNDMLGHYHNYTDSTQEGLYGTPYGDGQWFGAPPDYTNAGQGLYYYVSGGENTVTPTNFPAAITTTYTTNSVIPVTDYNQLRNASYEMDNHQHDITDQYTK